MCIEMVIEKLDREADICGGVTSVKERHSVNDVIMRPKFVLDSLIMYLSLVHNVDWYSTWGTGGQVGRYVGTAEEGITVRPDQGMAVSCRKEQEVNLCNEQLVSRTERFLEVTHALDISLNALTLTAFAMQYNANQCIADWPSK